MSFCKSNTLINEGDTCIVYLSFDKLYPIKVTKGQSHHSKYGQLKHSDLIGKKYGSRIQCTQGSVYVLQGSPEIWTVALPHRTQILYTPNISVITLQLELRPGSVVVESGTGSASLSHALVRSIYPTGHLHTFEFHLQRSEQARKEFSEHGLSEYATVYHRDACNEGFGLENVADAVFLDLPSPWKALLSAKSAIKKEGGRICSFSPCIEQVQKTVLELTQLGFTDIYTIESLRKVMCVKKYVANEFDFNMDSKQQQQTGPKEVENSKTTEKNDEADDVEAAETVDLKMDTAPASTPTAAATAPKAVSNAKSLKKRKYFQNKKNKNSDDEDQDSDEFDIDEGSDLNTQYTAKVINNQPGHTGFLTFATLLHKDFH